MRKTLHTFSLLLTGTALLALVSCNSGSEKESKADEGSAVTNENVTTEEVSPTQDFSKGEAIFKEKCTMCHMANGKGQPGIFPPLAGSDYLLADKRRAVHQVLNGSAEKMIVNGKEYTSPMPAQVSNHQDAVAVINYVLNAWGNDGGVITLEEAVDIEISR